MAPEVICRQKHNKECDYYALGVILFELLLQEVKIVIKALVTL